MQRTPHQPRFIAGALGPTAKQMAISTRVDDPAWRGTDFDAMVESYFEQVEALVSAGVDLLLPETFIDTLNLKACLFAIAKLCEACGEQIPVMASGTFGPGGVTFVSGQSVEAFWNSVANVKGLFAEYQTRKVSFVHRLRKEPWGQSSFIVSDPDGNALSFAG